MAIKIPVDADIRDVTRKVEALARTIEKASRVKWAPVDAVAIERETRKVEQGIAEFNRRVGSTIMTGTRGTRAPPSTAGSGVPTGGRGGRGSSGGGDFSFADWGRQFSSGVGGGFQTISGYAARGARGGGGMGLLRGGLFGAGAFAAYKVGQGISEGYDLSKERALGLDVLKRQMGDIGVSFDRLKIYADRLSDGLGVNSSEFVKLESSLQKLSRTVESPESLASGTALGVGLSRSYGLEAGAGGNFLGAMRNIDPRQNNRELALILADTIARSGMNARADEVMQAIVSFTAATTRMSLSPGNVSAFGNAYGGLLGTHLPGMTPETASGLLQQANSGVMSMGAGAGEAGRAFMLSAFNRYGQINPIQAAALAQGGLFGTRSGVFGSGAIRQFIGDRGMGNLAAGGGANVTNFDAIRSQLSSLGGSRWFQLEGAQRLFGVQSLSQAAALMNLSGSQGNGLVDLMHRNNLDVNKFSASGISRLGAIGAAGTNVGQLSAIFDDMKRTGVLNADETRSISAAQKSSPEQFRDALVKIASLKDQADTQGEQIRTQTASLTNIEINTGDKLLTPINAMRDALVVMSGRGSRSTAARLAEIETADINQSVDASEALLRQAAQSRRQNPRGRTISERYTYLSNVDKEEHEAYLIDEAQRKSATQGVREKYELTIHNNVNVKTSDGKTTSASSRTNIAPPSPSGSKSLHIETH